MSVSWSVERLARKNPIHSFGILLFAVSGPQILPDVKLTIVHPDTKVPCAHTDLGEVSELVQLMIFS